MPKKAHYRKFGVRDVGGQDDFAAMAEVVSRRFARLARRRPRSEYDEGFAAAPNLVVIDGGKGQLSAALAAMQALRPAARGRDRAREARGGGVRARPPRPGRARRRTRPGSSCSSASATRRTASRSASTASGARRAAFESIFDELPRRRAGAAARAAAALRLGRAGPRRVAGGAGGRAGLPAKTARAIYAQLHKAGRA